MRYARRLTYQGIFLAWFGFTVGVVAYLCVQAVCGNMQHPCTRYAQSTDGKWMASVHSLFSCEDAQRRADAFVQDHDYEAR